MTKTKKKNDLAAKKHVADVKKIKSRLKSRPTTLGIKSLAGSDDSMDIAFAKLNSRIDFLFEYLDKLNDYLKPEQDECATLPKDRKLSSYELIKLQSNAIITRNEVRDYLGFNGKEEVENDEAQDDEKKSADETDASGDTTRSGIGGDEDDAYENDGTYDAQDAEEESDGN